MKQHPSITRAFKKVFSEDVAIEVTDRDIYTRQQIYYLPGWQFTIKPGISQQGIDNYLGDTVKILHKRLKDSDIDLISSTTHLPVFSTYSISSFSKLTPTSAIRLTLSFLEEQKLERANIRVALHPKDTQMYMLWTKVLKPNQIMFSEECWRRAIEVSDYNINGPSSEIYYYMPEICQLLKLGQITVYSNNDLIEVRKTPFIDMVFGIERIEAASTTGDLLYTLNVQGYITPVESMFNTYYDQDPLLIRKASILAYSVDTLLTSTMYPAKNGSIVSSSLLKMLNMLLNIAQSSIAYGVLNSRYHRWTNYATDSYLANGQLDLSVSQVGTIAREIAKYPHMPTQNPEAIITYLHDKHGIPTNQSRRYFDIYLDLAE